MSVRALLTYYTTWMVVLALALALALAEAGQAGSPRLCCSSRNCADPIS